jgi:hypothetical protein
VVATTGVGAWLGTDGPASSGHPRCRERATCALDPGRCEPPDGSWDHSNEPGCGPTSRVIRNSRADRIREGEKKVVLRDHAVACPLDSEQPGRQTWRAGGACARLGRAGLYLGRSGDDWPAAGRPASGGPRAGTRDPGSNAGSSTAAGTCTHTLCAGRFAGAVGALWPENGAFPYTDARPKEVRSPEGKPGENALTFSSGAIKTRTRRLLVSLRFSQGTRQRIRRR